jgi:hypothetical protein
MIVRKKGISSIATTVFRIFSRTNHIPENTIPNFPNITIEKIDVQKLIIRELRRIYKIMYDNFWNLRKNVVATVENLEKSFERWSPWSKFRKEVVVMVTNPKKVVAWWCINKFGDKYANPDWICNNQGRTGPYNGTTRTFQLHRHYDSEGLLWTTSLFNTFCVVSCDDDDWYARFVPCSILFLYCNRVVSQRCLMSETLCLVCWHNFAFPEGQSYIERSFFEFILFLSRSTSIDENSEESKLQCLAPSFCMLKSCPELWI